MLVVAVMIISVTAKGDDSAGRGGVGEGRGRVGGGWMTPLLFRRSRRSLFSFPPPLTTHRSPPPFAQICAFLLSFFSSSFLFSFFWGLRFESDRMLFGRK